MKFTDVYAYLHSRSTVGAEKLFDDFSEYFYLRRSSL